MVVLVNAAGAQERPAVIEARADARVSIHNPSGSVSVTAWDRNEVAVYASRSSLRNLELSGEGNRIIVRAHSGFSMEVRVPKNAKLNVQCGSGSIQITGVEGTVEAESASGSLRIEGTPRSITAQGLSGGVTVLGGGTEITRAESVSGSVVITEARGVVDAKSSSGGVRVSGRVRDARLFSVSGSVTFNGTIENSGRLSAESSSASVELKLPANTSAEYELSTVSGHIENDFGPAATKARRGSGVSLNFSVGGGGARVKAASVSGSVRLTER
jgi:DUF4097 and DUF4098 domain-containing protein YvlB